MKIVLAAVGLASVLAGVQSTPVQDPAVAVVRVPEGAIQPQVAVDTAGTAHVVYYRGPAAAGDLFYARLDGAGTWSTPLRVNSQAASAVAAGNIRGARVALGRSGWIHVAWNGTANARPRAANGATPMLYARLAPGATAFEPQKNLIQHAVGLDGGGAIAADATGRVVVAWHAGGPNSLSETTRRVWTTESTDDGATFSRELPASALESGACGCCGMAGLITRNGRLALMFRAARELVHRDTYLLLSTLRSGDLKVGDPISQEDGSVSQGGGSTSQGDRAETRFVATKLQEWNVGACPMSSYSLTEGGAGLLAAWETGGQVQFARIDPDTGVPSPAIAAPGRSTNRKHPVAVGSGRGDVLFVWTEGMSYQRGGSIAWQRLDAASRPIANVTRMPGVPASSLVAAYARPDGRFVVVY